MSLVRPSLLPESNQRTFSVAVAGNPNCGKTTLFNALTGLRHRVGNYSGVTVEKREGSLSSRPDVRLLDLPGTYSLAAHSPDEIVARDVLLGRVADTPRPDAVLIVLDAANLERNLYLATQILDLCIPAVLACNMMDSVRKAGQELDLNALSAALGVPVIGTVGSTGEGIDALRRALLQLQQAGAERPCTCIWARRWRATETVETELHRVAADLRAASREHSGASEGLAALLLAEPASRGRPSLPPRVIASLDQAEATLKRAGVDAARELTAARYTWIRSVVELCLRHTRGPRKSVTDRLDRVFTHPVLGMFIFAPMMGLLFWAIFIAAEPLMSVIESGVSWAQGALSSAMPPGVLRDLLTDGVLAGVGNVLAFFPQIAMLFLFIAVLEDTGYMARAAFLMNRLMSRVGLHGRSFIPLLSSHACAVPGIMATRTIENPRDRLVTILVAPLMGCSARLPVYTVLIAACLPGSQWVKAVVLLSLYGMGVFSALVMAAIFKRTLLRGPVPAFMIELPPYRLPRLGGILRTVWDRSQVFLIQAGTIILALTIVLWAAMNFPKDAQLTAKFEGQRQAVQAQASAAQPTGEQADARLAAIDAAEASAQLERSLVGRLGHAIEPAIRPLGYDWKIGVAVIASVAAREVFVSTLGVVYSVGDTNENDTHLRDHIRAARWPDGRPVFTPVAAISLMVFYVLACQCLSTLAVVRRETGTWTWPAFMFAYMTTLAWLAAFAVYQFGSRLL